MKQLQCLNSGIIYRNPAPHVVSRHAYFPSAIEMDNGELLATYSIGQAFEAVDLSAYIARSQDGGQSWSEPQPLLPPELMHLHSSCARLTAFPGGQVVALVVRHDRTGHPDEGLANPDNIGFVPVEVLLLRSQDYGVTWSEPQIVEPPLEGPSFELCAPIIKLSDGRWIWPTSTWRGWDGHEPNGMKMVAFVSHDKGQTWPDYLNVMSDAKHEKIYWESKIIELSGGALLAVAWVYDEAFGQDLTNHYALSHDGGQAWTAPVCTGLQGQTMAVMELEDNRILSIYRRMDVPGLWANISHLEDGAWVNDEALPLWGVKDSNLLDKGNGNMVHDFNELKFGAPCLFRQADGVVFIAFWCYEKLVSNIRWFKLQVA